MPWPHTLLAIFLSFISIFLLLQKYIYDFFHLNIASYPDSWDGFPRSVQYGLQALSPAQSQSEFHPRVQARFWTVGVTLQPVASMPPQKLAAWLANGMRSL